MTDQPLVLVTGASGFIALHTILGLLERGYRVRGTVRGMDRAKGISETLARHVDAGGRLDFAVADLTRDDGWIDAVADCTYALHIASPFPKAPPRHEDELIIPARDGALRVLHAAQSAGVRRVVMTSSLAAVVYGHVRDGSRIFTEDDWSDVTSDAIGAYEKSKTIAEHAAWDFMAAQPEGSAMELAVINPGLVLGPAVDADSGTSLEAVRKLLARELPGLPRLGWAVVDVRDVAAAHIAAMTEPAAAGQRFICAGRHMWMTEVADILREYVRDRGYRVPAMRLPDWALRLAARFDPAVALVVHELGQRHDVDNARIRRVLNWSPRALEETVRDSADSLIAQGLV